MTQADEPLDEWYRTAFDGRYPILYAHRDDRTAEQEVRRLARLLGPLASPAKMLDLCCGGGRHTQAFAAEGYKVIGLDLSPSLLSLANERPLMKGRLVCADMRALPFQGTFSVVTNLFTSFGYFKTDRENEQALREMVRVLMPKGLLLLDHMNRSRILSGLVREDRQVLDDMEIRQQRFVKGKRVIKEVMVNRKEGEPIQWREDVRLYEPEEMAALFRSLGMEEIRFFGDFSGKPFDRDSDRMIVLARKGGC